MIEIPSHGGTGRANLARWGAFALVAVALVRGLWLCDDAFITMRVVDNLQHGYGLTWNPPERVQVFTHPLWLFVLVVFDLALPGDFWPLALPGLLCAALAVGLVLVGPRLAVGPTFALGAALAFSKAFVDYSSSGLENPLGMLLLALLLGLDLTQPSGPVPPRHAFRAALLLALLGLTRLDLLVLAAPVVALRLRGAWRACWKAFVAGLLPLLLWEMFAVAYFGFPFPNTAYAKLGAGVPAAELARQGWWYLEATLRRDPLTFALLVGGLAWLAWRADARRRLWALGTGLYLLYVLRIGGDFMLGRFLAIPYFIVCALAAGTLTTNRRRRVAIAVVALGALVPGQPLWPAGTERADQWFHGVGDERAFYAPATGVWARRAPGYREHRFVVAGREARRTAEARGGVTDVAGSVGFYGYYGGPRLRIIDTMAITDPFLARLPMTRTAGGEWRIGHFVRELPPGYAQTVASRVNQLEDPRLARLYDDLRLVTTGPLWDAARWRAIVRLNVGRY